MTALGLGLSLILQLPKDDPLIPPIIWHMANSGRIFADLHYRMSMTRRSFITPGLNPIVKNIAEECKVDTFLYGVDFSERLKSAKAAEKSGKDIKKVTQNFPSKSSNDVKRGPSCSLQYTLHKRTRKREIFGIEKRKW